MILKSIALSTFIFLLMCDLTYAQPDYSIHISDIRIPQAKVKNWYGRPVENDFIVSWDLYSLDKDESLLKSIDSPATMAYNVYLSKDSTFSAKDTFIATDADTALFAHIKSGTRYYFRVDGIDKLDSSNVVHSDVAWAIGGNKVFAVPEIKDDGFELPLFFPIAEFFDWLGWHSKIYFNSGIFGKLAFTLLWFFFLLGIYLVFFPCRKSLGLGHIFPFPKMSFFKRNFTKEQSFDQYMAPRFRFVIEAWKKVITVTNRMALNNEDGGGDDASIETINKKFFDYFKLYGTSALQVLNDVMDFNPQERDRSEKAEELEKNIMKYFGEGAVFGGIFAKSHDARSDNDSALILWRDVENELSSKNSKPLSGYSTVKILQAGLGNHITNGYHWQIVSSEVDRAIENRAASEHEQLKEKASVDWLWNLGTLSPLLGLFGTVTGISRVFGELHSMDPNMTQKELVDKLSSGIFEALWTTIYGLMAGIVLMILYYYFKNRLDWIYNRWQEIAVRITEKL